MSKHDNAPSELERVARAGWMVTLRYRLLLQTLQPPRRQAKWPLVTGGVATAAMAATGVLAKLGWI